MKTQRQEILDHVLKFGGITRATAAGMYIFELSSRIGELASQGDDKGVKWGFHKTPVHGKRNGRAWRVIRYSDPQRLEPQREMFSD